MARKLTPQAAFDKVARHLLKQNARSTNETTGECLYRGPNGLRCAIGALIPEGVAVVPEIGISGLLDEPPFRDLFAGLDENFLGSLQEVHDEVPVAGWRESLAGVAAEFNLSPAVLEATP
jgi:hypothetical protein